MKPVNKACWSEAACAQRAAAWGTWGVLLPLVLLAWWAWWQSPSRLAQLQPVTQVAAWHEPLGPVVFNQASLSHIVTTAPNWQAAQWQPAELPLVQELPAMVNLPPNAPKHRLWLRLTLPPQSLSLHPSQGQGSQAMLGLRVMGAGPWAVWANGQLLQANLVDWRIQWNVPLRVTLPPGTRDIYLAVPYAQPTGYAVGTVLVGAADVVDSAWQERNLWHLDMPRFMTALSLLLALAAAALAWARPREPNFKLLVFNALAWATACQQYTFDTTGQDTLSAWFGSAVDSGTTWTAMLSLLFAFNEAGVRQPWLRNALLGFASVSTLVTLPMWQWQTSALLLQHNATVVIYLWGLGALAWHVLRRPKRQSVVLLVALLVPLVLGVHTLNNLTNQSNPDGFYTFALGTLTLFVSFVYAMGLRFLEATAAAEQHEATLTQRLAEQEQRLAAQHAQLQQLAVQRHLSTQHDTIMQDLHDRLGSNLTSALLQARQGSLSATDTVLLLQDLTDELRHISHATAGGTPNINHALAELRERVQNRLRHGGIHLHWDVDVNLPPATGPHVTQHLRALLSEAMANAIKHGQAKHIGLHASPCTPASAPGSSTTPGTVTHVSVVLTDDGQGFDPATTPPGRGLPGMRQRAQAMGAQLSLHSAPSQGCRLTLVLPCATPH